MKNKSKPHINYLLSDFHTAQTPLVFSSTSSGNHNHLYNRLKICSIETKIECSQVINREVKTAVKNSK